MFEIDRRFIGWLHRHHVPLDVAAICLAGLASLAIALSTGPIRTYYASSRGAVVGVAALITVSLAVGSSVLAERDRIGGRGWVTMAAMARVAVVGALVLTQIAPLGALPA